MSLNIRHVTNGKKTIYRVTDSVSDVSGIYENLEDIPASIRYYAEKTKLTFAGPDLARMFGVLDVLYPNFPKCGHPDYVGKNCIAESCRYSDDDNYRACPYFDKTYSEE